MHGLDDIKKLRKRMGLTQQELARKARVSQSLLAKIETGKISPGYEKTCRIFAALDSMAKTSETKAGEIATRKVISASAQETVAEVIRKMAQHGISQLPVMEGGKAVGLVTDSGLLEKTSSGAVDARTAVSEAMEGAPPMISEDAGISAVAGLLKHFPIVMVVKRGDVIGVITKSDVLGKME